MTMHRLDADIKNDILAELKWDPQVKETDIGVIVKDGAVTLTGTVPFYMQKYAAEKAAKRVKGVWVIAEEIEVKSPPLAAGGDEDIAERLARIFEWNAQIPSDDIKAIVREGVVNLTGEVDWEFQRNYVQRQVGAIKGVRSVVNGIHLRKRPVAADIKTDIVRALYRHANVEANRVAVSVSNGVVTLSGDVSSYAEKGLIRNVAWSAPGVTNVVDNLGVLAGAQNRAA